MINSKPTPGQIMNHIKEYTRNPGCPFCRAYIVSKKEYKQWLKEEREKRERKNEVLL
jgi:hypothetical protein